ncbi:CHAT domain-containing protein [Kribbella sp. CWNU-51]
MYVEPAMVLTDTWSVDDVTDALSGLGERALVVVQYADAEAHKYYALDVGSIRLVLEDADPEDQLGSALDLEWLPVNRIVSLDDVLHPYAAPARPGDVLLRNVDVLGVLRLGSEEATNRGEYAPESSPPDEADSEPAPSAGNTGAPRRFRAFAALDAPEAAEVGVRFPLTVGFSDQPTTDDEDEQPIIVPGAPAQLTFVVQVAGFGFSFPDGISRSLTVDRDDPNGPTVEFAVVPTEVRHRATRTLEVYFEYDGERCGQAWHDVVVSNQADDEPPAATSDEAPPMSGGTGVTLTVDSLPPSLTVEVRTEPDTPDLEWIFHTRDGIPRPDKPVRTQLEQPSAQAFAEMVMKALPGAKGSKGLPNAVRGLGKLVLHPIPDEFWAAIEATWQSEPEGQTPSLLIITSEPFVPWELAWVDADSVDPALFPDGTEGPLAALWQVGRWVPPKRSRRGPDRPAAPPPTNIDVDALAVVIGDFAADRKVRELPYAVAEGKSIAHEYGAMPLTVSDGDVDDLMSANLTRNDAPFTPQAIHFASHGEVGLEHQEYTGVILSEGRRLDIITVEGSTIGGVSAPFVFLNACQVGTASSILSSYGGLAGSFLRTGFRGFLAPLWDVDDDVAKDIALEFYESTLRRGLTVGEALRRIRAGFGDGSKGTATPLAYVFYGHPGLRMTWSGAAAGIEGEG